MKLQQSAREIIEEITRSYPRFSDIVIPLDFVNQVDIDLCLYYNENSDRTPKLLVELRSRIIEFLESQKSIAKELESPKQLSARELLRGIIQESSELGKVLITDDFIDELDKILCVFYKKETNLSKNLVVILKNKIKFFLSGNSMIHKSEIIEPLENTLRSKLENACHTMRNSHFVKLHIESFQSKQHKKYDDHFASFFDELITSFNLLVDEYES